MKDDDERIDVHQVLGIQFNTWISDLLGPDLGLTRTKEDFAAQIEQVIETDPNACGCFMVDPLNTHKSKTLVRLE